MSKINFKVITDYLCAFVTTIVLLYFMVMLHTESEAFLYLFRLACVFCVFFIWRSPSIWLQKWAEYPEAEIAPAARRADLIWMLAGLATVVAVFVILELRIPYYFTHDDNYSQFLPVMIQGGKSLFAHGELATWNGFQLMGSPTASLGYYGLLYPPVYISYAIAHYVLGNDFITLNLFVWSHLIGGYFLFFLALRQAGLRPSLAAMGASAFIMMGHNIGMSQNWHYAASTAFWGPALVLSLTSFMKERTSYFASWRWILGTAIAIAGFYYAGHAQHWLYGIAFWTLGILWVWLCRRKIIFKDVCAQIAPPMMAMMLGLALCAPLLVVQISEIADVMRTDFDLTQVGNLDNMFTLFPDENAAYLIDYFELAQTHNFFGGIFIFLLCWRAAIVAAAAVKPDIDFAPKPSTCFLVFSFLALWLMQDTYNAFWGTFETVPPFSMFRASAKLLSFFTMFVILGGGQLLETIFRKIQASRFFTGFISSVVMVVIALFAIVDIRSFAYVSYLDRPYPALDRAQEILRADDFSTKGRVWPSSILPAADAALALTHNYSTFYNVPSLSSYDYGNIEFFLPEAVMSRQFMKHDFHTAMQEYGVEWAVVPVEPNKEMSVELATESLGKQCYPERGMNAVVGLHVKSQTTKPMSYIQTDEKRSLPYRITANGVDVDMLYASPGENRILIANFLYRRWLNAYAENGEKLNIYADGRSRIAVDLPDRSAMISIRYQPPWGHGLMIAAGMMMVMICSMVFACVLRKKDASA